ncbi:hypothetical protein XELAEV_18006004mg [Xenopus laevis]|uniref:Uncharacterized protein n=1 Tax=Xenopus laevis TaxID=8355 RepID=A0A974DXX5_XENLA|nr:hypothetical protein XELAEV_18006004mg [Xenopus laevis]
MPDEHKSDGNRNDRVTVQMSAVKMLIPHRGGHMAKYEKFPRQSLLFRHMSSQLLKGTERKGNMLHYNCTNKKNRPNILDLLYILIMRSRLAFREVMSSYKVSGYVFFEKNSPKKVSKKGRSRFF